MPRQVIAAAHSKHFAAIAENGYRFLAIQLCSDDTGRIRAAKERLSLQKLLRVDPFLHSTAAQRSALLELPPIASYPGCQPWGWSSDAWLVSRLRAPFFAPMAP